MLLQLFLLSLPAALCTQFSLYATTLERSDEVSLGEFNMDVESRDISAFEPHNGMDSLTQGKYCVGIKSTDHVWDSDCFSFMELQVPFSYDLVIQLDENTIQKVSLAYNETTEGIMPKLKETTDGPIAPASKLKKITKTYADKKEDKKLGSEETDEEEKPWYVKNWKSIVIGIIIYNLVVASAKKSQDEKQE
ncbi:hypothetical protein KAFR_0H01250 [Kazachstania africana CBS 2517]|uniref:ER membrane protein complex subunit 10 n=1 Tax=Kazachstania africana (strain ATCC 22294 / BCRC 22015 / CBS 2517 / CECT 1963 / NBRC 1671 / NRRL Y-8276) TaxID=1071382 RepID=H2AYX9_KAZAF|nr:hypothetical protein KAFR_0H01250 [Kazachstania africana CBS 2517]CCF59535.1 hypothetical protein KAFR_0H01250 [Kazachstania africana CBS 2517]